MNIVVDPFYTGSLGNDTGLSHQTIFPSFVLSGMQVSWSGFDLMGTISKYNDEYSHKFEYLSFLFDRHGYTYVPMIYNKNVFPQLVFTFPEKIHIHTLGLVTRPLGEFTDDGSLNAIKTIAIETDTERFVYTLSNSLAFEHIQLPFVDKTNVLKIIIQDVYSVTTHSDLIKIVLHEVFINESEPYLNYGFLVDASSYLVENIYRFDPGYVVDQSSAGSWCVRTPSGGRNAWIRFSFKEGTVVNGFWLVNGHALSPNVFRANNRVKTLVITSDRGESRTVKLDDHGDAQRILFETPLVAKTLTMMIADIYSGSQWNDTCINEIQLFTDTSMPWHKYSSFPLTLEYHELDYKPFNIDREQQGPDVLFEEKDRYTLNMGAPLAMGSIDKTDLIVYEGCDGSGPSCIVYLADHDQKIIYLLPHHSPFFLSYRDEGGLFNILDLIHKRGYRTVLNSPFVISGFVYPQRFFLQGYYFHPKLPGYHADLLDSGSVIMNTFVVHGRTLFQTSKGTFFFTGTYLTQLQPPSKPYRLYFMPSFDFFRLINSGSIMRLQGRPSTPFSEYFVFSTNESVFDLRPLFLPFSQEKALTRVGKLGQRDVFGFSSSKRLADLLQENDVRCDDIDGLPIIFFRTPFGFWAWMHGGCSYY
ncbi:MAG: hypothetical protein NZL83_03465 [Candidatus Absconditabacterales bacterium]|nr:hypothetical protein [Candidatus Absconditabacterales bacterium]